MRGKIRFTRAVREGVVRGEGIGVGNIRDWDFKLRLVGLNDNFIREAGALLNIVVHPASLRHYVSF